MRLFAKRSVALLGTGLLGAQLLRQPTFCDNVNLGNVEFEDEALVKLRPKSGYDRIDHLLLENPVFVVDHALHDTLAGHRKIEIYEVYKNQATKDIYCIVKFGDSIVGHRGVVHGGITALLLDNTFGWVMFAKGMPVGVTANLNVNYR